MKIYTKTGDKGTTSLIYGKRIPKNDLRVQAYGTCDEANSLIGLALSFFSSGDHKELQELENVFYQIQTTLFHVGAELATPEGREVKWKLTEKDIATLELTIDQLDNQLPKLTNFILPGGHPAGAALHSARTVVRRAERLAVSLKQVNPLVLAYLNRLSDFLFVAARFVNHHLGVTERKLHE